MRYVGEIFFVVGCVIAAGMIVLMIVFEIEMRRE